MTRLGFFAAFVAGQALAFSVATDSQGDEVRWRARAEFVLDERFAAELGLPEAAADAVVAAATAYDAQTPALEVRVHRGAPAALGYSTEPGAKNQSDIVVLHDWPFSSTALATTLVTVNARTNEIIDADIALNADAYEFGLVDVPRGDERTYDVQNTVMHELGHALGLAHNAEDPGVVMYPGSAPQETCKRRLADDDIAGLQELYAVDVFGHPELASGCTAAPGGLLASWLALLGALWGAARRTRRSPPPRAVRRCVSVGLAVLAVSSQAAEPARAAAVTAPDEVAWAEVVEARSHWLEGTQLIVTDVEVEVRTCVRGACPTGRLVVQVVGGRVGDLEQYVAHQPKVVKGAQVLVVKQGARRRLLSSAPTGALVAPPGAGSR